MSTKRLPPAPFKATVRTKTSRAEMTLGSVAEGIELCFFYVPVEQQQALIAKLTETHAKLTASKQEKPHG